MNPQKDSISQRITDISIVIILILLAAAYLWHQTFYTPSTSALVNFSTFSYVANEVLFNSSSSLAINPEIAEVVPVESMPLLYPPGIYIITKLISYIKDNQLTMHLFIFSLQLLNVGLIYILLRKVADKFISFSLAFFLLVYTSCVVVVVDSFIQPLLALILLLLVSTREKENYAFTLLGCGLLTAAVWLIRQNVGLFLCCVVLIWLNISSVHLTNTGKSSGRLFLWALVAIYILCGLLVLRIIGSVEDKIWYVLCYLMFWGALSIYIFRRKDVGLNLSRFVKNISLFLLPLFLVLAFWFYSFGNVVGLRNYLHIQFILPFSFINVFYYPLFFHLNLAWNGFVEGITQGGMFSIYDGFQSLMRWGVLFLIPFVINFGFAGYILFQAIVKTSVSKQDMAIASLGIVGILSYYPIESAWILSSKLVLFFLPCAYLLGKMSFTKRRLAYAVCLVFFLLGLPPALKTAVRYLTYDKREASYMPVCEKVGLKLPPETAVQLSNAINLIKNTIDSSRFYIVDSYTDLEMFYGLTNYKHPNYYIFLRKDAMTRVAEQDLIKRLEDYPYILINQQDYWCTRLKVIQKKH